jgi:hypothetical protein
MSKKKRAHRSTPIIHTTAWSDLEEAFFASAPPDEPQPIAEPPPFDDELGPAPRRRAMPRPLQRLLNGIQQLIATVAPEGPDRRTVAFVLAAAALLIGLGVSAAVLASR